MVRIPVLGRLFWSVLHHHPPRTPATDHKSCRREYIALAGSLILIFLEGWIRVITLGLRNVFTESVYAQLSDFLQPNQLFDSATIDPRTSSTYFPPRKAVDRDQNQSQSLRRSRALPISWTYALCLAITRKSMSCRQEMDTCLGYIVSVIRGTAKRA